MAEGYVLGGRFAIGRRLGKGSFGEIFSGAEVNTSNQYAIKVEPIASPHPSLQSECKVLQELKSLPGIPRVHWFVTEGSHHFLVMDLLGPSLDDLFKEANRRFSLKTVLMVAEQLLTRLEGVHARGYLHKDLKPANCLVGLRSNATIIHLIDFGLAKKYLDVKSKTHILYHEGRALVGTARYASLNAHLGIELSRRDDLESLFYIVLYLLTGCLPWQNLPKCADYDKHHQIAERKLSISPAVLCKDLPGELQQFLLYVRRLKFEEKPDYEHLRQLLRRVAQAAGAVLDLRFDWILQRKKRASSMMTLGKPRPKEQRRYTKCVMEDTAGTRHMLPKIELSDIPALSLPQSSLVLDTDRTLTKPRCWPGLSVATRQAIDKLQSPTLKPEANDPHGCRVF